MALHLIDGLPGSGKTQFAIKRAIEMSTRGDGPGRAVFYDSGGVGGSKSLVLTDEGKAKLGWLPFEANDWLSLPEGALIVIDEVQFIWPVRPAGRAVPDPVAALATHRHRGFDFLLITQDGSLLDQNVRKIVQPYTHLERPQNQQYSKVWEFEGWCEWSSTGEQAKAQVSRLAFDKGIWNLYKSATLHTYKAKVPKKMLLVFPALAVVIGGLWFGYSVLKGIGDDKAKGLGKPSDVKADKKAPADGKAQQASLLPGGNGAGQKQRQTMAEWIADRRPRVPELPHTAPLYDELTRPISFPVVSGCVEKPQTKECTCYTQQGTIMSVSAEFCYHFVKHGAFDHFKVDPVRGVTNHKQGVAITPSSSGAASTVGLKGGVPAFDPPPMKLSGPN